MIAPSSKRSSLTRSARRSPIPVLESPSRWLRNSPSPRQSPVTAKPLRRSPEALSSRLSTPTGTQDVRLSKRRSPVQSISERSPEAMSSQLSTPTRTRDKRSSKRHSPVLSTSRQSPGCTLSPIHSPCLSPARTPDGSPSSSRQASPRLDRQIDQEEFSEELSKEFSEEFYSLVRDWLAAGSESSFPDLLRFNKLTDAEKSAFYTYAER